MANHNVNFLVIEVDNKSLVKSAGDISYDGTE